MYSKDELSNYSKEELIENLIEAYKKIDSLQAEIDEKNKIVTIDYDYRTNEYTCSNCGVIDYDLIGTQGISSICPQCGHTTDY